MNIFKSYRNTGRVLAMASLMTVSVALHAEIQGVEGGTVFDLYAGTATIPTPDGDSLQIWGYSNGAAGLPQYPGPTLIVPEGPFMVTLHNVDRVVGAGDSLPHVADGVSLQFPGIEVTSASTSGACSGGTDVAMPDCSITYMLNASAGTYMYNSGVSPQIQIDMGLFGALVVRPSMPAPADAAGLAYNDLATAYDREYLYVLSEMDPKLHYLAENTALAQWDNADYHSVLFFMNGRNGPDTLAPDFIPGLPHQPYGSLTKMYPGERVLIRVLNAGRNQHPYHTHGNHFDQIARDGSLIMNTGGTADPADDVLVPITDYTLNAIPGSTADAIWTWTGRGMGWDIYDSTTDHGPCDATVDTVNNQTGAAGSDGYHDTTWEYCADHGKPLPVVIPENQDLGFGGFYGGSPFLGTLGALPVGEGGLNPSGGMVFMWHSHTERELTNNDIFPGGMLTMMIVERRPMLPPAAP